MAKKVSKAKTVAVKKKKTATSPARARRSARPIKKTAKTTTKKTLKKTTKKVDLQYTPWHTIPLEDLNPLLQRQFLVGQDIMLARVLLKKGCIVPEHTHHNEQMTYILEGSLKFRIDGQDIIVNAGEVLCIPSHMPHGAEALADTVDLDVFTPPRADWIGGTDKYLRGVK
jgi:quercetin dioxygenase-like cupin family protein